MIERLLPVGASAHAASLDAVLRPCTCTSPCRHWRGAAFFIYCLVRFRRRRRRMQASHAGMRPALPVDRDRARHRRGRGAPGNDGAAGVVQPSRRRRPRRPRPWKCASSPSSSRGTFSIRDRIGRSGRTSPALVSASNPLGIDRTDEAARDDVGLINTLMLPVGRPVIVHLTARDVDPLVHAERDAREAGRHAGTRRSHVVHPDNDRQVGNRVFPALRVGPLPDARRLHGDDGSRLGPLARRRSRANPACCALTPWPQPGRPDRGFFTVELINRRVTAETTGRASFRSWAVRGCRRGPG